MSARRAFRLRSLLVGKTDRTEVQLLRSAGAAHLGFWVDFAAFSLIGLVGVVVMLAAMWFLTELVHLHYLLSKVVSSVLVFAVNFTMRKLLLFRP